LRPEKEKSMSLWFFFLFTNCVLTLFSGILLIVLVSSLTILILAISHIALSLIALGAFLLLGHKYPALKEGVSIHL
jgi:hypothetical protein